MSKKMSKTLYTALDITATGAKTPVRFNESPLLGGGGSGGTGGGMRNAFLVLAAAVGGSGVIKLQGHDSDQATAPADADSGWYDIVATINSASPLRQEIELAPWMRFNVGTAGTGTLTARVEGVQ